MKREAWDIVSRNLVSDHNVLPVTWYFKFKMKPGWTSRKFKALYYVRVDVQNRLSHQPLNSYSPVVQWYIVMFLLILQFIIVFQSQSIALQMPLLSNILQVGIQCSFNFPGISIVMEDNIILLSG